MVRQAALDAWRGPGGDPSLPATLEVLALTGTARENARAVSTAVFEASAAWGVAPAIAPSVA